LTGIENLAGGTGNDVFVGNDLANALSGGTGDDMLAGGAGDDILDGGIGTDTADYSAGGASSRVAVTLDAQGTVTVVLAAGDTDTLIGIENLLGGAADDLLFGDGAANVLRGGGGDDTLRGGAGNDVLDGGTGSDTADYGYATVGVSIALDQANTVVATIAAGGDVDSLIGIDNLIGSAFDDRLTGDDSGNRLAGGGGNDLLIGGAGEDLLFGDDGDDTLQGGAGNDTLRGGAGNDVFAFGSDALSGADVIQDLATGDIIDLSALLSSLAGAEASASARSAFVQFLQTPSAGSVEIWIDPDGAGSAGILSQLALIEGQTTPEQVRSQTNLGGA
jgi:Ca2+-binding RTX toxin-like protein